MIGLKNILHVERTSASALPRTSVSDLEAMMRDTTDNRTGGTSPGSGSIYLDGTYLSRNATWHTEDSAWKAKQILRMLSRNQITPSRVCEVGCGAGEILLHLSRQLPSTVFAGYELSPQAFELCKTKASERVRYFNTNLLEEQDAFNDVLLCIDVFEHVEDYMGFLRGLRPKATYKVFHIPLDVNVLSVLRGKLTAARKSVGHLHYFTPETAVATLSDCGYEILDSFLTPGFADLPATTLKSFIARFPRKILYAISPSLMVRLLGGCSLLVLAR